MVGSIVFSLSLPKCFLPKMERKLSRVAFFLDCKKCPCACANGLRLAAFFFFFFLGGNIVDFFSFEFIRLGHASFFFFLSFDFLGPRRDNIFFF